MKFFIDESGNTGDLIMTKDNFNFSSQEYFTLGCIGFIDEQLNELNHFTNELKRKYKIQNNELKFGKIKHIFGKKIGFVLELLKHIEENSKILIEIVDKKYIIATNIVNCLVSPPYFQGQQDIHEKKQLHLLFSQWIYEFIPNDFFISFSNISRNPSKEGLENLFQALMLIIKQMDDDSANSILANVEESYDDYKIMQEKVKNNPKMLEAFTYFLPLPDLNKRGELIGILPHIGCFTNIHARLNHIFKDNLSSTKIIHDNQDHFDEIIKQYHESAIKDTNDKDRIFEMANFNFKSIGNLEFQDDKDTIGLQVADIFAGFVNKAIPYLINHGTLLNKKEYSILLQVLARLYYQKSINFVLPIKHHQEKLFPIFDSHLRWIMSMAIMGIDKDKIDSDFLDNNKSSK